MNITIAYKSMESSPAVEEKIKEKCHRLEKYFKGAFHVDWTCHVEKDNHISEVYVSAAHHKFHAHSEKDSLYKTIDDAIEKLEKQMARESSQEKEKIHR